MILIKFLGKLTKFSFEFSTNFQNLKNPFKFHQNDHFLKFVKFSIFLTLSNTFTLSTHHMMQNLYYKTQKLNYKLLKFWDRKISRPFGFLSSTEMECISMYT